MKKNVILGLCALLIAVASCSFTNKNFESNDKDKLLIELITYVLERGHYEPKDINDTFSQNVFNDFIDILDPTKRYFLASDIEDFEQYKFQIDEELLNSEITFFNVVYDRLMLRMEESKKLYTEVLEQPFDYTLDETLNLDYEKVGYARNVQELKERWRIQLKYNSLGTYSSKMAIRDKILLPSSGPLGDDIAEVKIDKDKLDPTQIALRDMSLAEVEASARESTKKTLDEFFELVGELTREDWFVQYVNTIVDEFDPHTYFFPPEEKDKFDISMSGKFEGIGARLQKKPEGAKIVEIISGGPVWRAKTLEVGDEILKVAQEDQEAIDIVGMRLDDAIKLIKGPKGSIVKLTVRRLDGTIETVSITRDVVEIEESYAKSTIINKEGRKFGMIHLPKFYVDFEDYTERNAASDVAAEVERLKEAGMEGLVLDLRDNGGGSLKTVVDMAGLFIKSGPIVQVRSSGQRKEIHEDQDERIQWDGPLVILVNELSASASEILAAAMQDYRRAIVIGSKQTFGKGTVQNVIPLENIMRSNEHGDLGAIKLTTQKFYRINGGSTQLEGVKSDIVVPDRFSSIELGERSQDNPLGWDKISPADYTTWEGYIDYENTIARSKNRLATNDKIKLIEENADWVKAQQDETIIPLNYEKFKADQETNKNKSDYFKKIRDYDNKLSFESLKYEKELFTQDELLREKRDRWHQELAKDIYLEEAIFVLEDLKTQNIKGNRNTLLGVKD